MASFHNLKCFRNSILRQVLMVFVVMQLVGVSNVVQGFHVPSKAFRQHQQLTSQQKQQPPMGKSSDNSYRRIFSSINMISPDQVHDLFITASMQHGLDISNFVSSNKHVISEVNTAYSTSRFTSELTQWISDASTTAATSTTNDDGSWWNAYINIFKSILTFVHTTIDGPLRSVGIEQTWGVSIFLFTASK
jgi:hypothetical protein